LPVKVVRKPEDVNIDLVEEGDAPLHCGSGRAECQLTWLIGNLHDAYLSVTLRASIIAPMRKA